MKQITYGIDLETGFAFSKFNGKLAIPVLDFGGMKPENNFETRYYLDKFDLNTLIQM